MLPVTCLPGGIRIAIRLTPRGGADRIDGIVADGAGGLALAVRVSAAPVDGAANDALVRCLAKAFGAAKRDVRIVGGATSRLKRVEIAGPPGRLQAMAEALLDAQAPITGSKPSKTGGPR